MNTKIVGSRFKEEWILSTLLVLIFFSPSFNLGVRAFYIFEVVIPVFLLMFIKKLEIGRKDLFLFFAMMASLFFLFLLQYFLYGKIDSLANIRIFYYFLLFLLFSNLRFSIKSQISLFANCVLIISVVGILQNFDGLVLGNSLGVNKVVAFLYPYKGVLDENSLNKVGGLMLKMGSGFRATSTLDGHPILFGDFIAICSVPLLFFKRYKIYLIATLACILTFSRGSWLMLMLGVILYVFLERKSISIKVYIYAFTFLIVTSLILISIDSLRDAFFYRIYGTLYSFGLVEYSLDFTAVDDPRTSMVWPRFFEALEQLGISGYLAGIPYNLDTDSGYLSMIKDGGVINLFIMLFLFIPLTMSNIHSKQNNVILFMVLLVMIFHPLFLSYKTIAILIYISTILSKTKTKDEILC